MGQVLPVILPQGGNWGPARDILEVVEHLLPGQLPPVLESLPVADAINALGRIKLQAGWEASRSHASGLALCEQPTHRAIEREEK